MDSLFHFILAILAGMAVGLHMKHGFRNIVFIALIAVLIDVDHFMFGGRSLFHNIFTLLIPIGLFLFFYHFEKGKIKYQSLSLILFAVLVSHFAADLFYGNSLPLLWPFSQTPFALPEWLMVKLVGTPYLIVSKEAIALLLGGGIIMLTHFVEDFIYFFEKKHLSFKKAINKVEEEV